MSAKAKSPAAVLELLKKEFGAPSALAEPRPLEQLVLLLLARGADVRKAEAAMKELQAIYVDWNEVRVTSAYELRKILRGIDAPGPGDKADQLKELLGFIFNRFNKLNLDFLRPGSADGDSARKRDRFQTWLGEKWPALSAILSLHGGAASDVATTPALGRVLSRLEWLGGKSTAAAAIRECIQKLAPEGESLAVQWVLHHLAERYCLVRAPLCADCPVAKQCPSGKDGAKAQKDADSEAPAAKKAATKKSGEAKAKKAAAPR